MKNWNKKGWSQLYRVVLMFLILVASTNLYAQDNKDKTEADGAIQGVKIKQDPPPTLAEIIPQAALLSDKLATLNNSIDDLVDVKSIEDNYKTIAKELKTIATEFKRYKTEGVISTSELDNLKVQLKELGKKFKDGNEALKNAIELLEKSRADWLKHKNKWTAYQELLLKEEIPDEAKLTLIEANNTIQISLNLVVTKLNLLMKVQQIGYDNQSVINDLSSQILLLRQEKIVSSFENATAPMYSPRFYSQFKGIGSKIKSGIKAVNLPNSSFFQNYWWLHLFQIFITILVIYLIQKNRNILDSSEKYKYFSNRSISAGVFFGVVFVLLFHIDMDAPPIWRLFSFTIGGLAFCRLISGMDLASWKKHFFYALVFIIIVTGVLDVFNFPIQLFRIFVLSLSLFGIYMLYKWNKINAQTIKSKKYIWFFNSVSVFLGVIIISEFIGKEILALYMYEALLKSIMLIVFVYIFIKMIQASIEAGLKIITIGNNNTSKVVINKTAKRIAIIVSILTIMFVIPRLLVIWGVYNSISDGFNQLITIGFNIGDVKISLGVIITSVCILYMAHVLSTIFEMILMNDRFDKDLDKGTRLSMAQLLRYFLLFFGFILAIATFGFDLTSLTIVLSALGVGIGFGLQGIVNNFVSGLILLFERPIREGDTIELEGEWSEVRKIGLRSTTVQTFDQSEVIIPNADLVYNKVTNWTLSNSRRRVKILVGVAYGSDVALTIEKLKEVGSTNSNLVKNHKPVVLFQDFADSSLNFELRVWARNALESIQIESDLREEIDKVFRENNIEIAFPQRDLHLRSVSKEITLGPSTNKD